MLLNPLIAVSLLWLMKLLIDDVFIAGEINLLPLFGFAYVVLVAVKLAVDYILTPTRSFDYGAAQSERPSRSLSTFDFCFSRISQEI